jgi:uncharacterized peroxidase-related enzyme
MARLATFDPATATGSAADLFGQVKSALGIVPNMTKVMANSPAVLGGYVGFFSALSGAKLPARLREQIALLTAEVNRCSYCLSAHTAIGKLTGLSPSELAAARDGSTADARGAAALRFASRVLATHGGVHDDDLAAVRRAGYSDGEIAEIIAVVALNVFTNYFNKAAGVDIDFPVVRPRAESEVAASA